MWGGLWKELSAVPIPGCPGRETMALGLDRGLTVGEMEFYSSRVLLASRLSDRKGRCKVLSSPPHPEVYVFKCIQV